MHKLIYLLFLFIILFAPLTDASAACDVSGGEVCLKNPINDKYSADTPNQLIGQIINGILGIVGSLALAMFIYGGLVWMTTDQYV